MLSNKDVRDLSLKEIAEIARPYTEDASKLELLENISDNAKLQKQYEDCPERDAFLTKLQETGVAYFVINHESRKYPWKHSNKYPIVRVYVGMREDVPILSLRL